MKEQIYRMITAGWNYAKQLIELDPKTTKEWQMIYAVATELNKDVPDPADKKLLSTIENAIIDYYKEKKNE